MAGDQKRGTTAGVEAFIDRARALDDRELAALAEARGAIDEIFHAGAWKAAHEIVAERAQDYLQAWIRIGTAFLPERLEELVQRGSAADPAEVRRWQDVARLARAAIDDALLARVGADLMRPPDLRELNGPWQKMQGAVHERSGGAEPA